MSCFSLQMKAPVIVVGETKHPLSWTQTIWGTDMAEIRRKYSTYSRLFTRVQPLIVFGHVTGCQPLEAIESK